MIKCSLCWEEKCFHFKVQTSLIKSTDKKQSDKYQNEIACNCGHVYSFEDPSVDYVSNCPKCRFKVLISKYEIYDYKLSQYFTTPRHKCQKCKTTGILSVPKFLSCENCLGSGGQVCPVCYNKTYTLNNESSGNGTQDCIVKCCGHCGGNGWLNKCQRCMGMKVLLSGQTAEYDCNHCIVVLRSTFKSK